MICRVGLIIHHCCPVGLLNLQCDFRSPGQGNHANRTKDGLAKFTPFQMGLIYV
jgi:hypothetical protein